VAFVKEHYNTIVNDDIADAICIGYAYTNKPIPVTKNKVTNVEKITFE
jgi:hypothetical protein